MQRLAIILGLLSVVALIFFFFLREVKKSGTNEQIVKEQTQQIEIQNETIIEQKEVFQRKVINKSFTADDNLQWLQDNICQNCKSR